MQSGQVGQQNGATPWYRKSSSYSHSSPQLYQFTPGTGRGMQRAGYGTKGPPPPRFQPQQEQPQQQVQQQQRPSHLAAAAGRRTADVATTSRPQFGRAAAAPTAGQRDGQHRAVPKPWAPAAATGAAGAGAPRRSESPPAPQRLFDGIPEDRSAAGVAGRQLGTYGAAAGAAAGAGFGAGSSSALTPPANFGAVLREEFQAVPGPSSSAALQQQAALGYGSMHDALDRQAAELEAKIAAKAAQFERQKHKSKVGARHRQLVKCSIYTIDIATEAAHGKAAGLASALQPSCTLAIHNRVDAVDQFAFAASAAAGGSTVVSCPYYVLVPCSKPPSMSASSWTRSKAPAASTPTQTISTTRTTACRACKHYRSRR